MHNRNTKDGKKPQTLAINPNAGQPNMYFSNTSANLAIFWLGSATIPSGTVTLKRLLNAFLNCTISRESTPSCTRVFPCTFEKDFPLLQLSINFSNALL